VPEAATGSKERATGRTLRVWASTWAVGGAVAGGVLALAEPGHLPRPLIPPLLAAVGAVSGLVAGALDRLLSARAGGSPAAAAATAMVSGLLVGLGLWRFGLGTTLLPSAAAGALLALIARRLERRPAGGAPGRCRPRSPQEPVESYAGPSSTAGSPLRLCGTSTGTMASQVPPRPSSAVNEIW
jgi:hypothetical protein